MPNYGHMDAPIHFCRATVGKHCLFLSSLWCGTQTPTGPSKSGRDECFCLWSKENEYAFYICFPSLSLAADLKKAETDLKFQESVFYTSGTGQSPGEPGGRNTCRCTCLGPGAPSWLAAGEFAQVCKKKPATHPLMSRSKASHFIVAGERKWKKIKGKQIKG